MQFHPTCLKFSASTSTSTASRLRLGVVVWSNREDDGIRPLIAEGMFVLSAPSVVRAGAGAGAGAGADDAGEAGNGA
jgi:hypothetical protein